MLTYWLAFALLCAYLAINIHGYRAVRRKPRPVTLAVRLAPYRGGWFPRSTPATPLEEALPDNVVELHRYSVKAG